MKLFDPIDNPGHYSSGKAKFTFGTIRSVGSRGLIRVLWDGENRQIESHWKDLQYLTADEDPQAAAQVPVLYTQISNGSPSPDLTGEYAYPTGNCIKLRGFCGGYGLSTKLPACGGYGG